MSNRVQPSLNLIRAIVAVTVSSLCLLLAACSTPEGSSGPLERPVGHRVLTHGNGQLTVVDRAGQVEWSMPWGSIHDLHRLPSGNILVQRGASAVVEIDFESQQVVWSYDSATSHGNAGRAVEVHAFQPLENGHLMIAESGVARIIEVDRQGRLMSETPLKVDRPHPHSDTRLVRKISPDRYLVCHERDGVVREYQQGTGQIVWEYDVPLFDRKPVGGHGPESFGDQCFCALRLENGNTLIATGNGHSVIEVTTDHQIVWRLDQYDLPEICLSWVTTLEVLPNGHYVIGNCHAGPGQPLIIEIDRVSKEVVWTFDHYPRFGNSVPNSLLLDVTGSIR
ncbi:MAG: PQQ-binding-like beta-propeller repeat protein [Planctomycetota bacterium]|nr:PQQ-binding-like beta-propeller repeat protein [Planctomycetota bacterium]